MNWLENKLARIRISSPGYYERRRQEMIHYANVCEQNAKKRFEERVPDFFNLWMSRVEMFRKRAAWYVNKKIEAKYGVR